MSVFLISDEIAAHETYLKYINQFDVIYLDMAAIIGTVHGERAETFLVRSLTEELKPLYPDL